MDKKQFELFQSAIQWVADEQRRKKQRDPKSGVIHEQNCWGAGKIIDWIKAHISNSPREQFAQVCPSACCLAGNIVLLNGDRMVTLDQTAVLGDFENVENCLDEEGRLHSISTRAQQLAGLTGPQATRLFAGENYADQIIEYAQEIAVKNGYELEVL